MDLRCNGNFNGNSGLKRLQKMHTDNQPKVEENKKQPAQKTKGDEKDCAPILDCNNIFEEFDLPSQNTAPQPQNNLLKNLSPGLNKFEYGGAKLDLFKRKAVLLKQFVTPQNFDRKDFIDEFPELKEIIDTEQELPAEKRGSDDEEISEPLIEEKDLPGENERGQVNNTETEVISEPKTVDEIVETQTETTVTKPSQINSSAAAINGEIDESVLQGSTGDCWVLSAVLSLNSSATGKEIIKNSITVNDDSSVTVSFKGLGISYTIDPSEISKYDTDNITSDAYSNGDNDMLVLELAAEKLRSDIKSGKIKINSSNTNITYAGDGNGLDDGGLPVQMLYYLTGIESDEIYNKNLNNLSSDKINAILDKASNNTVLSFIVYGKGHSAKLVDGSTYSLSLNNEGHALAITNVTDNTVTFTNPWDSGISYTMTRREFVKLGVCYMCSTDLGKTNLKNETVDMTKNSSDTTTRNDSVFKRMLLRNFVKK